MSAAMLFVGTYTQKEDHVDGKGKGIYSFSFDLTTGALAPLATTENVGVNPSFITSSARVLYAVNEVCAPQKANPSKPTGYVRALAIEEGGTLRALHEPLETKGAYPCHVALSPQGNFVVASNYGGGSVSLHAVNAQDGSLQEACDVHAFPRGSGAVPARQEASHLHSAKWAEINGKQVLLAADLGDDVVAQFILDPATKTLHANGAVPFAKRPPGSGPRHIAIQTKLNMAYVADELSSTIGVHTIDQATGALSEHEIQKISMLPTDYSGPSNLAADIHVSTCGQFLYASNRGHDSIACFRININAAVTTGGQLELIGWEPTRGLVPRAFLIHGSFLLVANQNSDTIEVFLVDATTGKLTFTGHNVDCPTPVSLVLLPSA